MLEKFERFVRLSSNWFTGLGVALILANLAMIFIDIISSKAFSRPVSGSIELAGLSQALIIASATAITQLSGQQIRVEIVVERLPKNIQALLNSFISLVLFFLFIWIIWQVVANGMEIQKTGQYTSDLHLPIHIIIYLTALVLIPTCFVFLLEFFQSTRETRKR